MLYSTVHDIYISAQTRRLGLIRNSIYIAIAVLLIFGIRAVLAESLLRIYMFSVCEVLLVMSLWSVNKGKVQIALLLFFAAIWMALVVGSITVGGGESLVMCWWVIFICLAGLMGGKNYIYGWSGLAFTSVVTLWYLNYSVSAMEDFVVEENKVIQLRLHLVAQLLTVIGIVWSFLSVTAKYEKQVVEYTRELEAEVKKRTLAEADALASQKATVQFFANMSHELRTPLNCILGFSMRLLKRPTIVESVDRVAIERIHSNGQGLSNLVDEMFELANISLICLAYNKEPISLCQLLNDCVTAVTPAAQTYGLKVKFEVKQDVLICADRVRLHQAILNIVYFCVRQTKEGEIILAVTSTKINELAFARVDICDTSSGIAPEQLADLFESHYQFVLNSNKDLPISALALVVSSKLITLHKGSITVESERNKGTHFTIHLPIDPF